MTWVDETDRNYKCLGRNEINKAYNITYKTYLWQKRNESRKHFPFIRLIKNMGQCRKEKMIRELGIVKKIHCCRNRGKTKFKEGVIVNK